MLVVEDDMCLSEFDGKIAFAVGTGRCGTKFIYELMRRTPGVHSTHERHPLNDSFHRYCKWYNLPVDERGFITVKDLAIRSDFKTHSLSFEASAHLSMSIPELYKYFGAKFILMVRSPKDVVESYYRKGWYGSTVIRNEKSLAPGLYEANPLPGSLWQAWGRILPIDETAQDWNGLTQTGRLAWYWNALNQRVVDDLSLIPKSQYMIIKIEEFSYKQYMKTLSFLDIDVGIGKREFNKIVEERPNKSPGRLLGIVWTEQERIEFERFVQATAFRFGYDGRAHGESQPRKYENRRLTSKHRLLERLRMAYGGFILREFRKRFYRV